ncbi:MAG: signal peptidase I [Clostridia bacterium]|nr:signal peptidase I [Clostridia bacterium]
MEEKSVLKEALEWGYCIVIAIILALLIRYYIGTPTIVKQPSMFPTLKQDQRLWLNRWGRTTKKMPKRGEIITFEAPSVTFLSDCENPQEPVAVYNKEPKGIFAKFTYYVLEIGKTSYIKRVVGLPGEHIEIKDGKVFVNGDELQEEYLQPGVVTDVSKGVFSDFYVPKDCVFAIGDNRSQSTDCRAFGCIPLEKIESSVAFRFWPFSAFGTVK